MFCKQCGKEIPDDSRFCLYCGTDNSEKEVTESQLEEVTTTQPKEVIPPPAEPDNKPITSTNSKKKTPWLLYVILGIVLIAGLAYFASYSSAKSAAINGNYRQAEQKLKVPSITKLHDKHILEYIQAGKEADNKNYLAAYAAFEELASEGYADSSIKLETLRETIYQEAVSMYRKGDRTFVEYPYFKTGFESFVHHEVNYVYYQYFELCAGYKDSDKYMLLAKASSGDITDREYNSLVSSLDFEDTKEVLLFNQEVAERFLLGLWKSDDQKYSFSLDKEGYTEYILPNPKKSGEYYYSISNGLYFVYPQDKSYSSITQADKQDGAYFLFKIVDANTISVFCYEDGTTHILIRQ